MYFKEDIICLMVLKWHLCFAKHKNTTAAFRHKNLIKRNVKIKQLPSPGRVRSAH